MDIINPPAARETDQRKSRAVFSFIGAAKMDFKRCAWSGLRQYSGAHDLAVKHPPVRDDHFVPYIEGDLFAVARGEHVVSRTELAAIERQELGANDFLRTGRENAEGRIQANENPRREASSIPAQLWKRILRMTGEKTPCRGRAQIRMHFPEVLRADPREVPEECLAGRP